MARKIVVITHPDGSKRVIVGKQTPTNPVKSTTIEEPDRRPKPIVNKAGLTKERTPYKYGGKRKIKFNAS